MRRNSASDSQNRRGELINFRAKRNGNMPAAAGQPHLSALVKPLPSMSQTLTANTRSVRNHADLMVMSPRKAGYFRQMPSGSMICTAIYGNGARITGPIITCLRPGMAALIKARRVTIGRRAAVRGMNRPRFAAAPRACESWNQMQMSLWAFEWFVM